MIAKLCAAEGKFRQLNAIKEGLDVQLVKQAHFLLLVARDLQSDIGKKLQRLIHILCFTPFPLVFCDFPFFVLPSFTL